MSFSRPSYVSPTTGSDHQASPTSRSSTEAATRASRTIPTLWVLVIATGDVSRPDSRTHSRPVSSPLPFSRWHPAKTGSRQASGPRGETTVTPVRTGPWPTTEGPSPEMSVVWPTRTPATSVMALSGPGRAVPDGEAEVSHTHPRMLAAGVLRRMAKGSPYHPVVIPSARSDARPPSTASGCAACPTGSRRSRPIDVAEAFRDLPGLALFESARPGRNARWTYLTADPIAVLESPAAGPDPFAVARSLVGGSDATPVVPADAPRFLGGLVGFLGYDLGATFERLPAIAAPDQDLPPLRLALHDWVVAFDRRTGFAWLGGRALDGDGRRLARRLDDVHARLTAPRAPSSSGRRRRGTGRSTSSPVSVGPSTRQASRPSADTSSAVTSTRRI